jgi:tetratricopeptide (TPR) repeat protein
MNAPQGAIVTNENELGRLPGLLRLLAADPDNSSLRSQCVNAAIAQAEYKAAEELVHERLRVVPLDPIALFDNATLLIAQKDFAGATPLLKGMLANGHRQIGILLNLGLCQYCLGDFAAARAPLEEAYASDPGVSGLVRLLVSTLHHLQLVEEAVKIADANADAARKDGALAGVYALLYLDADQPLGAARWAKTALALNPNCVDGLVVDGMLRITQMRTAEAEQQFKRALSVAPHTGRAWLGLGTLALLAQDTSGAKQAIHKALEFLRDHVGTWHMLAWTHLLARELPEAEAAFMHALELNRNFAETHGGLAAIAALRGDRKAAETSIEVAERLDPECLSAKFAASVLSSAAGDPSHSQRIIAEAGAGLAKGNNALAQLLASVARR